MNLSTIFDSFKMEMKIQLNYIKLIKTLVPLFQIFLLNYEGIAQSIAKPVKTEHDFGLIETWDTKLKTTFSVKNEGDKAFNIRYVSSNCGCTVPLWDKKMIEPGEVANIMVEFDPTGKKGIISKQINVYTRADVGRHITFTIKAKVILEEDRMTPLERYIKRYGSIKFDDNTATFIPIHQNETKSKTIIGRNIGKVRVEIKNYKAPNYLKVEYQKQMLQPNDTFHITITAMGSKMDAIGKYFKEVKINTDDFFNPVKDIFVVLDYQQFFPPLTKRELRKYQKMKIDTSLINFGKFQRGIKGRDSIVIKNTGKKLLKIYSINSYCKCLKTDKTKFDILPGKTKVLQIYFDPVNKEKGIYNRSFQFICNDPRKPRFSIPVQADLY